MSDPTSSSVVFGVLAVVGVSTGILFLLVPARVRSVYERVLGRHDEGSTDAGSKWVVVPSTFTIRFMGVLMTAVGGTAALGFLYWVWQI